MKKSTIAIVLLSVALVVSNLWWLYTVVDAGVTASYRQSDLDAYQQMFVELQAVVPVSFSLGATREAVLSAARAAATHDIEFEKDGYVWVGHLGCRFNEAGRLAEVQNGSSLP